jgi:hypothetical protein
VDLDEAFRKLHGRSPSEEQRAWLRTVESALGLHDNDAFWFVVMMLEHYNGLYRDYPQQLAAETGRAIEGARMAFAAAAKAEAATAQRKLADEVIKTSGAMARKLAERSVLLPWLTAVLVCTVLFGGLCVTAGFKLATTARPFWVEGRETHRLLAAVLGAPAGWMVFALILPTAIYGLRCGWQSAVDAVRVREKVGGWGLITLALAATAACALMLAKVVG